MKFGIALPIWQLSVAEAETLTLKAEELGLDGVFIPDHILAPAATTQHYGGNWPDPFATLAYLAGRTSRVQLGTSVIILPYRNPLVTAKAAATVDQVSGGRFVFGVGVGWDEEEFRDLGLPFRERGQQSDEYIRIIKAAWASDVPSFQGRYFQFAGATFSPRPLQQPHPPFWVGGHSAAAMGRAATFGDAWHPLGLSLEQIEDGLGALRAATAKTGRRDGPVMVPRNTLDLTDRAKGDGRPSFQGSPEEVAADIRRLRELGVDYFVFDVLTCPDVPSMARLLERFVREVAPAVA